MRTEYFYVFVFVCVFMYVAKAQQSNLKATLEKAEKKYEVFFAYDDDFIRSQIPLEQTLPKEVSAFLSLLERQYGLNVVSVDAFNYSIGKYRNTLDTISFCGSVFNQFNDFPIPDALVTYGKAQTLTDAEGNFKITAPKSFGKVAIRHVSFGTHAFEVPSAREDCLDFPLLSEEVKLGEVIVNYIVPGIDKNANGAFEIRPDRLNFTAGNVQPDIFESLQLLPGVSNPDGNSASIYVRGGTPDQNRIVWNEIRIYQPGHAAGGVSAINPFSVKQVEFLHKGISPKYSEHTSALALLNSYADLPETVNFKGSIGATPLEADVVGDFKWNQKNSVSLSARSSLQNSFSEKFTNQFIDRLIQGEDFDLLASKQLTYRDFNANTFFKLSTNQALEVNAIHINDFLNYQVEQDDVSLTDQLSSNNLGLGAYYTYVSGKKSRKAEFSYVRYQMDFNRSLTEFEEEESEDEIALERFTETTQRNNLIQEVNTVYSEKIQRNTFSAWEYGFNWNWKKIDLKYLNQFEDDQQTIEAEDLIINTLSPYGLYRLDHYKGWAVDAGLRFNYFPNLGSVLLEPRLSISKKMNSDLSLNTSYERKSQSVYQTNETLSSTLERGNNLWVGANNDEYPLLVSYQTTFGFIFNKNRFLIDIDVYTKKYTGLTTFHLGYLNPNSDGFDIGESNIKGLDVFLRKDFLKGTLWTSYTFLDNVNQFEDLNSGNPFNSNFFVKHNLNVGGTVAVKGVTLGINFLQRSGIPFSQPVGVETDGFDYSFVYEALNTSFLPDFKRLDASLQYQYRSPKRTLFRFLLSCKNILNHNNVVERIFVYDSDTNTIENIDKFSLQPLLNFGVRVLF